MEPIEIQLKSSFRCPSGRTWGRVLPVIGAKFARLLIGLLMAGYSAIKGQFVFQD